VILLAEDDEDVREMLAFTLSSRGFAVETVGDGGAVLESIARTRPCLIILDLVMPVMTGQEVLAQMKARRMDDVPVCVISALGGPTPPEAVACLCKPFEVAEVVSIAAKYCRHEPVDPAPAARG
jgi:DNA-binding response OmpR family regulator